MCRLKLLLMVLCLASGLTGCGRNKNSYNYLMTHPEYLQQVYNRCVQEEVSSSLPCEIIMQAQSDFTSLVNLREQDAERFGAQMLQAEAESVFLKNKFKIAWQDYSRVEKNRTNIEEIKRMRLEVDKAREEYKQSRRKVKILLTVIAVTTNV